MFNSFIHSIFVELLGQLLTDIMSMRKRNQKWRKFELANGELPDYAPIEGEIKLRLPNGRCVFNYTSENNTIKKTVERAISSGILLNGIDLRGVDLSNACLVRGKFLSADMRGADLSGADLSHASLTDANLTGANLTGVRLTGCSLPLWAGGFDFITDDLTCRLLVGLVARTMANSLPEDTSLLSLMQDYSNGYEEKKYTTLVNSSQDTTDEKDRRIAASKLRH